MTAKTKKSKVSKTVVHKHKPRGVSAKSFERIYWPYLPLVVVISALLIMGGQSGAISSAIKNPTGNVLAYATSMSINGLRSATNSERASHGAGALSLNSKLNASAQAKANDMADRNYWSHNTPEGDPPWTFMTAQGYSYQKLGENLAAGFSTENATVAGWMASAPHKANLIDPAFTEVGFGFANNDNYTSAGGGPMTIVVAHYGKPTVIAAAPAAKAPASAAPKAAAAKPDEPKAAAAAPVKEEPPAPKSPNALEQPYNTDGLTPGTELAAATSRIQAILGSLPAASVATTVLALGAAAAVLMWVSKHALAVRRAVVMGETFAVRHPLVDVSLITIAALAYLLTRTAGLIQ